MRPQTRLPVGPTPAQSTAPPRPSPAAAGGRVGTCSRQPSRELNVNTTYALFKSFLLFEEKKHAHKQ